MLEMGTFRIEVEVENPAHPGERRRVENVLVDTGAELSWLPSDILETLRTGVHSRRWKASRR